MNLDLIETARDLYRRYNIKFIHVRAHKGNKYNEMADELTNHIFKITLGKDIEEKQLGRYEFGFGLCTEIAEIKKSGKDPDTGNQAYKVSISDGETHELNSIVCALNKLAGGHQGRHPTGGLPTTGYKFSVPKKIPTTTADGDGGASITFFITKTDINIVKVIIRYKGDFTAAPVFTATLTQVFKDTYLKGCPPGGH